VIGSRDLLEKRRQCMRFSVCTTPETHAPTMILSLDSSEGLSVGRMERPWTVADPATQSLKVTMTGVAQNAPLRLFLSSCQDSLLRISSHRQTPPRQGETDPRTLLIQYQQRAWNDQRSGAPCV
jgi:hypothetical protein